MITTFCLWWVGINLNAPKIYYLLLMIGLSVRFLNSVKAAKLDRKVREHLQVTVPNIKEQIEK